LLFVKGRYFLLACRELAPRQAVVEAIAVSPQNSWIFERHARRAKPMAMRFAASHAGDAPQIYCPHCSGDHAHDAHGSAWAHAHGPEPAELAGPEGWRRGLYAVMAVGLRPCSGAIIVLIFALAQDLFWTGTAATLLMGLGTAVTVAAIASVAVGARTLASRIATAQSGFGMLTMRAIEVGAAALIVAFGVLLLAGYMASEQLWMFTG
jgi:nickel/cobalt exporter